MCAMPVLKARLHVLLATAAVFLLSACDRYPWDPPKPTTDTTSPERRIHPPATAVPLPSGRQSIPSWPIALHGSSSDNDEELD